MWPVHKIANRGLNQKAMKIKHEPTTTELLDWLDYKIKWDKEDPYGTGGEQAYYLEALRLLVKKFSEMPHKPMTEEMREWLKKIKECQFYWSNTDLSMIDAILAALADGSAEPEPVKEESSEKEKLIKAQNDLDLFQIRMPK